MATKLKVVEDVADIVPAPTIPEFTPAPTRKRNVGWTAERQRIFIKRVALTGNVGEACALVGLSSSSFYRLCQKPEAEGFVRAWKAARLLAATRGSAIAWDRAINGRTERFYKDGELVMVRRIPSDYLLTWFLARLDPLTFGSPAAKAHALATGDPLEKARKELPQLMASFADVPLTECECDENEEIDEWRERRATAVSIRAIEPVTRARTRRTVNFVNFRFPSNLPRHAPATLLSTHRRMRSCPPTCAGGAFMATSTRGAGRPDPVKWTFFGVMGLCVLLVLWADERFWLNPADPHWKHVAPVKYLLMLHGLAGATALGAGALQMSSRIRRNHTAFHRALGKVYLGAVTISAPVAVYMGTSTLEPASIRVEQIFQGGFWLLSAWVAYACIRSGQMQLHKAWMMRSYAFTLIFITSRVPDAFVKSYTDQALSDMLWGLVAIGLVAPEIILTTQALWKIRSARARAARSAALPPEPLPAAE